MAYRIKGCGCDCATAPANPCEACAAAKYFQIQCRSRSGTATLCGYPEYTNPTVPPKAYKKRTLAGSSGQITHDGLGCGGSVLGTLEYVYSGSCQYNPAGAVCSLTEDGTFQRLFNGAVQLEGPTCSINTTQCPATAVLTQKQMSFTPDQPCINNVGFSVECEASATETLSDEDTEEAAMGRVAAAWTPWGSNGCGTSKQLRAAGAFSFNFIEGEYRIRVAGTPGEPINIELTFTRDPGAPYTEIRQFVPTSLTFPAGAEEGWQEFSIQASPGGSTSLAGARIYEP